MKSLRYKLLTIIMLTASSTPIIAGSGGDAFVGGLAGGTFGGILGGAISRPREKTVVVQQPTVQPVAPQSTAALHSLERENRRLLEENDRLRQDLRDLRDENRKLRRELSKR